MIQSFQGQSWLLQRQGCRGHLLRLRWSRRDIMSESKWKKGGIPSQVNARSVQLEQHSTLYHDLNNLSYLYFVTMKAVNTLESHQQQQVSYHTWYFIILIQPKVMDCFKFGYSYRISELCELVTSGGFILCQVVLWPFSSHPASSWPCPPGEVHQQRGHFPQGITEV